jgi:hypothetical protein
MGSTQKFIVRPSNVYLIEIIKPIAYLPLDKYTQYASKGPGERFYINKGAAGRKSIGAKSVKILAQCVVYYKDTL